MIASLKDAREGYESVRTLAAWMGRMGRRYWEDSALADLLGKDSHFRSVEKGDINRRAERVGADLDDLAVLLLFSVFEAIIRERALLDVNAELPTARHPALRQALKGLQEALAHGSFAKVLEAYKELDADRVEEVAQVRRYRNWVAHGRRGTQPNAVDPQTAYDRLQGFLELLSNPPPP